MLRPGDPAPPFTLTDQDGEQVRSSDLLAEGPVVLFFYPRALSPGCTKESCHFRDLAEEFAAVGARRVGVSADPVERQAAFAAKHALGYPLLSDPDRSVAAAFGVKRFGPVPSKRATFVIDTDGTILEAISSEVNMDVHADRALEVLRARAGAG